MRYDKPAGNWQEGLPIGSGRLAAMVWGDACSDLLTLNHEWIWRGANRERKVVPAAEHLEHLRTLLREGRYSEATVFGNLHFGGKGGMSGEPAGEDPYQPAGELRFTPFGETSFKKRALDIQQGFTVTERFAGDKNLSSCFFVSCIDSLIYARWESDGGKLFCGKLDMTRVEDPGADVAVTASDRSILLDCTFKGGISYRVVAQFCSDGIFTVNGSSLDVSDASYINCVINIATSVHGINAELERFSMDLTAFHDTFASHKEKFAAQMDKVSFYLKDDDIFESEKSSESDNFEQRLRAFMQGGDNNGICVLYYNYARYLMISCTICGELPPNLQGKWNDRIAPPWDCDYHFDINLQMAYWPVEPCRISGAADLLFSFLESFYESGEKAARELYGCRGLYLPLQTDAWGISTPESYGWAVWLGAAPWMAQHFWHHYIYSGDKEFLRERAYPYFVRVAEFYEDYLVRDENSVYQIMPSQSPENRFEGSGDIPVALCVSAAMDVQLCHDALSYAIDSAGILGIDADRIGHWENLRDNLPGFPIGKDGRLLEWNEEKQEVIEELGHRHISHLYGVHPGELFTSETRKEQYIAARKSLDFRLKHGGGHTGWSRALIASLMARFGDGEGFYEHFTSLIRDFSTLTLLDIHPTDLFQIDGNFGGAAAVNEALIRCVDGKIHLLCALPGKWKTGEIRGIKTPGGHIVDLTWKNGNPVKIRIKLGYANNAIVCYNGKKRTIKVK